MKNKIDELRDMATVLLAVDTSGEEARKRWGENVKDLLQELSIYHFELEHQKAALAESEHNLAESRAMYAELFENAPVGYVLLDRDMYIHRFNQTFNEIFVPVLPYGALSIKRKFSEFICSEYQDAFDHFFKTLSNSGSILTSEIKLWDRLGRPRFVTLTAGKRKEGDEFYRLTINDINRRKRLETELTAVRKEVEKNDRKETLFLSEISQELRTPLTALSGYCEMLMDPDLSAEVQKQYITSVGEAVSSLKLLTNEISDLSLLNSGTCPLCNTDFDPVRICKEQVLGIQSLLKENSISIISEFEEMPILTGDVERLKTVIYSILKYVVGNANQGKIRFCGHHQQYDNGEGFLIFEFYGSNSNIFPKETEEADRRNTGGLRLFLARQTLKILKGQLCQSGDLLRLEIPMNKSPLNANKQPRQNLSGTSESSQIDWNGGPKTCLLVDDVLINLKVLAAMLRKLNCIPITASSGKEAIRLLNRNRIDLIMTDLWMPEMNGMEFAMIVRQMPEYNKTPIIAVTADAERTQNFDMRYFNDTIIKPVSLSILKDNLKSFDHNGEGGSKEQ